MFLYREGGVGPVGTEPTRVSGRGKGEREQLQEDGGGASGKVFGQDPVVFGVELPSVVQCVDALRGVGYGGAARPGRDRWGVYREALACADLLSVNVSG